MQERSRSVSTNPEEAMKMITGLKQVLCEGRLRQRGLFSVEKAVERSYSGFQCLRGPTRELDRDILQGHVVIGHGGMTSNKEGRF